jgi:hypothetical protein
MVEVKIRIESARHTAIMPIGTQIFICLQVAFRNLVRHYGCDLAFSPMILADSFYNSQVQYGTSE